jgi:HK97 family phage major capsid protein
VARRYVNGSTTDALSPEMVVRTLTDPEMARKAMNWTQSDLQDFQDRYISAMSADGSIQAEVQRQIAGVLRENGNNGHSKIPLDFSGQSARKVAARSVTAPGVELNGVYNTLGEIVQDAALPHPDEKAARKLSQLSNSFGSTVPADGGFLIPETLRSDIATLALESAIVRPRATVFPMSSLRLGVPTTDDTSHASSVFGGLVAYWTEETATLTESQASFGRVALEAKKLSIYGEIPNELMADSPALDSWLQRALPSAVSFYEDAAFLTGTGVGEPLGVHNAPALVTCGGSGATREDAGRIRWSDVVAMYSRMLPDSLSRAVWVASPGCLVDLLTMQVGEVGTGAATTGGPAMIGYGGGGQAAPTSILGRPLLFSEKVPDLSSAKALSFIDFSYYLVGDRQQAALTVSEHYKFANDKVALRLIERVDGRPWINSAVTPKNGGSTLSPFVGIA